MAVLAPGLTVVGGVVVVGAGNVVSSCTLVPGSARAAAGLSTTAASLMVLGGSACAAPTANPRHSPMRTHRARIRRHIRWRSLGGCTPAGHREDHVALELLAVADRERHHRAGVAQVTLR